MGATEVLKSRNIIICSPDWCYSHLNTNAQIAWLIVNKSYSYRESSEAMNVGSYTLGHGYVSSGGNVRIPRLLHHHSHQSSNVFMSWKSRFVAWRNKKRY
ncbi:protein of unknown function (plasmid) [Escherichia coli]|nr:protein of unknown function [Escherichia coli]